jgi:5-methylcytosine-specific restriction endonuclease McrA
MPALIDLLWAHVAEPLLRWWPGYPPDWQRRRMAVYQRAAGRCERCGRPTGRIDLFRRRWRLVGAHIHHVRPIADGGRHELANLAVRCPACHADEHPGNTTLASAATQRS